MTALAILLGPYRNLSTLTAATLAFHPHVQVLNHAGERLLGVPEIDFIGRPSVKTYNAFLEKAVEASAAGKRGDYGGAIIHSHAFEDSSLRGLYERRYGKAMIKPDIRCVLWKESMRVQNVLQQLPDQFQLLCEALPDVKFILPIRHPLDCAVSNLRTGHIRHLGLETDASLSEAVTAVADALAWGLAQRDKHPGRVVTFLERESREVVLQRLASFLDLPYEATWVEDAQTVFRIRNTVRVPEDIALCKPIIASRLSKWPDLVDALIAGV